MIFEKGKTVGRESKFDKNIEGLCIEDNSSPLLSGSVIESGHAPLWCMHLLGCNLSRERVSLYKAVRLSSIKNNRLSLKLMLSLTNASHLQGPGE